MTHLVGFGSDYASTSTPEHIRGGRRKGKSLVQFLANWLDRGLNAAKEERATLCKLQIFVDNKNVCCFVDYESNETVDHITLPAVHLAEGIASNWWLIFGGRDQAHPIQRYQTGFALPALSFRSDGSTFEVIGRTSYNQNPHLRFSVRANDTLTRTDAELTLSRFVYSVVEKLRDESVTNSEVAECWSRVSKSRRDPEEREFCEAAGALGVDPYVISEVDARFIEDTSAFFSQEPLFELLAGARTEERSSSLIDCVNHVESRPQEASVIPELGAVSLGDIQEHRLENPPWAVGYRAARAFRKALGATPDVRFQSPKHLAKKLGASKFDTTKLPEGIRALVSRADGIPHIHLHDHQFERSAYVAAQSNNFAFARAVGDALIFRDSERSVVNNLRHAERQATGRAFAAEFLAPVERIMDMQDEGLDIDEIADEFDVSSYVIDDQLHNEQRIWEACATP